MSKSQHSFQVGVLSGGRHAAVSLSNPYFCLVKDTQEEAVAAAHRALNFYFEVSGSIVDTGKTYTANTTTQSSFRPLETLEG